MNKYDNEYWSIIEEAQLYLNIDVLNYAKNNKHGVFYLYESPWTGELIAKYEDDIFEFRYYNEWKYLIKYNNELIFEQELIKRIKLIAFI